MDRPVAAVALAALLVLAGCAAPTPPATTTASDAQSITPAESATTQSTTEPPTSSTTDGWTGSDVISVKNGSLPVNASFVFTRVTTLLATNASPPKTVDIRSHSSMTTQTRGLPTFATTMGIGDDTTVSREVTAGGITSGSNYVALNARLLESRERTHGVLVHEFVHVVQYQQGSIDTTYANVQPGSTDSQMAYLAVVEGVPVFVEDEYEHTYGDGDPTGMDDMVRGYQTSDGVYKYALAPYAFGAQYAQTRLGDAARVDVLYEDPPRTTETLIHAYAPGEEPIRSLETDVEGGTWSWSDRDRLGELFVRQVLVTALLESEAATAAAGWGVDRQFTFTNGEMDAYVWALRWDSPEDADEFESATRAYLDHRGLPAGDASQTRAVWRVDDTTFRLQRTSPEVVVLVVGPPRFVSGTTVSGSNDSIDVNASAAT